MSSTFHKEPTLPVIHKVAFVGSPDMLIHQPDASKFQQRIQLLDDALGMRNAAKALNGNDRIDTVLLNATMTSQFFSSTADDFVLVTETSTDSVGSQLSM